MAERMPIPARQPVADLAKGLAVLLMIQVHLVELFARPEIYDGRLGRALLFLGGPPVAPVFMAVFGYFLAASRRSTGKFLERGAKLLGVALLLNAGLNAHLFWKIHTGALLLNPWEYLFGVDILVLASVSILVIGGLRLVFRRVAVLYLGLALVVATLTPLVNDLLQLDSPAQYALAVIGGTYRWSYFPLFPWLAYPLVGYGVYGLRQQYAGKRWPAALTWGALAASGAVVLATLGYGIAVAAELDTYYHHGLTFFGWTALFMGFWMLVLTQLERHAGSFGFLRYLKWVGRNVTTAYVLQWLIIGNIATALYKTQDITQLGIWFVAITVAVSIGVVEITRYRSRRRSPVAPQPQPEREAGA